MSFEIIQLEKQQEKRKEKREESLQGLWHIFKRTNICMVEVSEGEEKERGRKLT